MKIIIIFLLFIISCHNNFNKYSENSEIEDFLNSLKKSRYSYLVNYLLKEPIIVSFNPDSSLDCPVVNLDKRQLLVPRKPYKNYNLILTQVAKSLYEYKIKKKYNITNEVPYEFKLISAYFEIEFIITHLSQEVINEIKNTPYEKKICSYILDEESFEKLIKDEEYITDKRCLRPSIELSYYLKTIKQLRESLNDVHSEGFFRIIYDMEIEKAKRGDETYYDAYRNYYYAVSKPEMNQYRDFRRDIYLRLKSLKSFERFYKSEIKKLKNNRIKAKSLLSNFVFCGEIK
ncbi:MAG: hypothetical protein N2Z20_01335 [Elusimicrobiales bacterium]|nr:hypothetical protein [Elusimicrobiales bacterium]